MQPDQRPDFPRFLEEVVMIKSLLIVLGLLLCESALAEMRAWTFKTGKTLEAEFVAFTGGQIALKTVKGNVKKIPESQFSDEDLLYIELINPPILELSFGKTSSQRMYPPTYGPNAELPRQTHYEFTAKIRQKSSKLYNQALTAELFIISEEHIGDKRILNSYMRENFHVPDGSGSTFELKTETVVVTEFISNGQLQGERYDGYMIIITDSRGEIVAAKATKDAWLNIAGSLRKVPVGRTFDPETGNRCRPSRPRKWY